MSFEEKCDNLLITSDEKCMWSHFDARHTKQGLFNKDTCDPEVSSSHTQRHADAVNEENVNDNSDSNSTFEISSSNNYKESYIWESVTKNSSLTSTVPLVFHEMKDLLDEILSKYNIASDKFKTYVGLLHSSM